MTIESIRPPGFPLSEEELQEIKRIRMGEILSGRHISTFSEWVLRGVPKEPFNPTVAIGIFPTPAMGINQAIFVYEPEIDVYEEDHRPLIEYWKDITTLPYPDRVKSIERLQYRHLVERGDEILQGITMQLMKHLMPSAMIAFSRPKPSSQESAYLICPTFVPPSAAYRHILAQARQNLRLS